MVRILAVSDEVDEGLRADVAPAGGADLIVSCGDLPFDYLGYLMDALELPLVFVPGNHDPDVSGYRTTRAGLVVRAGLPAAPPWPAGAVNADGRMVAVAGLRIAGLGGGPRYRSGPNQYTERRQARRARALSRRVRWQRHRPDMLITHAPPRGVGDRADPPHVGFACLHPLTRRLRVPLLLHGHVHPFGEPTPELSIGPTVVRNVVGWHLIDVPVSGGQ